MKDEVLLTRPIFGPVMAEIERDYAVHKLWLAKDQAALLKEVSRLKQIRQDLATKNRPLVEQIEKTIGAGASHEQVKAMSPDERDQFTQRFVTAQYHRAFGPATELSVQGYYNGAGGWYRIANGADGLYQYNLDWSSVGATASYHAVRGPLDFTWGDSREAASRAAHAPPRRG